MVNGAQRDNAIEVGGVYKSFGEPFSFKRILKLPVEMYQRMTGGYKKKSVLRDLAFTVESGAVVGFLGPNGAGKSTTLKVMLNLIRKDAGECRVLGFNTEYDYAAALEKTGALVELPVFYEYLTGYDNLFATSKIFEFITPAAIEESMKRVGLWEHRAKKVSQYSTGMRQKLYVAKILLMRPSVIILDEPTSGMDPKGQAEMREIIRGLSRDRDVTILVSSHLLYEIEQVCDFVVIIKEGSVVTFGRVGELLSTDCEIYELEVGPGQLERCVEFARGLDFVLEARRISRAVSDAVYLRLKKDSAQRLPRELVNAGFDIFNFMRSKKSLEDFFLEVTAEETAAAAPGGEKPC